MRVVLRNALTVIAVLAFAVLSGCHSGSGNTGMGHYSLRR